MATLADSFLADLDDLSDDEAPEDVAGVQGDDATNAVLTEAGGAERAMDFDNLDAVAKLVNSERYQRVVRQVQEALAADNAAAAASASAAAGADAPGASKLGVVDEGAYQLIVDCNALSVDIDNEIQTVHNFIRDKYRKKFPELESLVMHPIDYARVVRAIDRMDPTKVELDAVLPPQR